MKTCDFFNIAKPAGICFLLNYYTYLILINDRLKVKTNCI